MDNTLRWLSDRTILFLVTFQLTSCNFFEYESKVNALSKNDTISIQLDHYANDSLAQFNAYVSEILGINRLDSNIVGFKFRIWMWADESAVITIEAQGSTYRCNILTFRIEEDKGQPRIIVNRRLRVEKPYSGWENFVDSLSKFNFPSTNSKINYSSFGMLTSATTVDFECIQTGHYSYRHYVAPKFYRNVIFECKLADELLNYVKKQIEYSIKDESYGFFSDPRQYGLDSAYRKNKLYFFSQEEISSECNTDLQFKSYPESLSPGRPIDLIISNGSKIDFDFYIGMDQFVNNEWRGSFLDLDGIPPDSKDNVFRIRQNENKVVKYRHPFASFGNVDNVPTSPSDKLRLVIYFRKQGEVYFKRCAGLPVLAN